MPLLWPSSVHVSFYVSLMITLHAQHWPVFRGGNGSSEECKDTSRVTQPTFCKEKTGRLPGLPLRLRGSHDTPCFKLPVSCLQFLASYSSPSFHLLSCQLREAWGKPGHTRAGCCPSPRASGQMGTSISSIKRLTSSDHGCGSLA